MSENVQSAPASEKPDAIQEIVEIVKTVVYALLIALVLRVLFFQPFTIPSASMEPNLLEGDYIIVSKYSYGYSATPSRSARRCSKAASWPASRRGGTLWCSSCPGTAAPTTSSG